jgi:hypothetical protein
MFKRLTKHSNWQAAESCVFFSMGLIVGHGVMPFSGLWILGSCWYADSCTKMYGGMEGVLYFILIPMLMQWVIILVFSSLTYYPRKIS